MAYAYPPQPVYQPQPAYAMRTTAPVSLHVVAIFQYLGGLLTLGAGALIALAVFGGMPRWQAALDSAYPDRTASSVVTPVAAVVIGIFAVVGLIAVVLGRKVQRGRNWA